jgi:ubiquinone/menaquinone biosynthesis C-methylase UbiE
MVESKEIVEWLTQDEIRHIDSSMYWNDVDIEKEKDWWIESAQDKKLMMYLKQDTNLERGFLDLVEYAEALGHGLKGLVLDLAAGTCWTSAIASKISGVQKVISVDISRHRLEIIAPLVFEQCKADTEKITRVLGSFYEIKMGDNSVDCVILMEAFHHAFDVNKLILEIRRVLKPKGIVLISGEHIMANKDYFKIIISNLIKKAIFVFKVHKLLNKYFGKEIVEPKKIVAFPVDEAAGDHVYPLKFYANIFNKYGFELKIQKVNYNIIGGGAGRDYNFLAIKKQ